ncbi:MAG: dipeptidase [Hypericibacter sp.]
MTTASTSSATNIHAGAVVIDCCSGGFQGWSSKIEQSGATALVIGLASGWADHAVATKNFENALLEIERDRKHFTLARAVADIRKAKADGKVAIVFNFQNGQPIEGSLNRLLVFRELGLRNMQLTYNERNFIGDGCLEPANSGLSKFGREVVKAMNRWGIGIDLSHVGERTALEAMTLSEKPCIFSHSNPKARANSPRNATDEQIKLLAEGGGVIGINGWGPMLWTGSEHPPTVEDFVDHIEYVAELVGVDHVGIATDARSTDNMAAILEHARHMNETYPGYTKPYLDKFGNSVERRYPVSLEHFPLVTETLLGRGWTAPDIHKVMGGNFMRVWEQVWVS